MSILGIDAAWTNKNPSGIALLSVKGKLVTVAPSFASFCGVSRKEVIDWYRPANAGGSLLDVLNAAKLLLPDDPVSIVSVDMPVSKKPINARRVSDNIVSKKFASVGCSTHSPSSMCPGLVSEIFSQIMTENGYTLAVDGDKPRDHMFIEVYPHTALLRLMDASYRVPYKTSKKSKYWPNVSTSERRSNLLEVWDKILKALSLEVGDIDIPTQGPISLKPVEDALDAVICAWVGHKFVNGKAESMGDEISAIWTPLPKDE